MGLKPAPEDLKTESVDCFVCGCSEKHEIARAKDYDAGYDIEWSVKQCDNCGFVYTDPRPTMDCMLKYFYPDDYVCYAQDALGPLSDATLRFKWHAGLVILKKELEKLLPNPNQARMLDVGCAHGRILKFFREKTSWEVEGVEPIESVAQEAMQTGAKVHVSTLEEAELPDNHYDVVILSHLLEHVENPDVTVRELYRIIKPGGYLYTVMPDHDGDDRKALGSLWWGYHLPRHLYHFDYDSVCRLLEQRGLQVLSVRDAPLPNLQAWNLEYQARGHNLPDWTVKYINRWNPALWPVAVAMGTYFRRTGQGHSGIMRVVAQKSLLWESIPEELKEKKRRNENAIEQRRAIEELRGEKKISRNMEEIRYLPRFMKKNRPMLYRFWKYAAKNFWTRQPTFWGVDLAITYKCNLKCKHCFAESTLADPSRQELTTDQWIYIIKHLLDSGCIYFQMQGGEPTTRDDLYELLEACEPERSIVNVISNGILIGEEELQRYNEIGVTWVDVSLDSAYPEEHAVFRGLASDRTDLFEHGLWVVRRAKELGMIGGVFTTVSTENLWSPGVQELIRLCREERIPQYLSIAIPVGAWEGRHDLLINAIDREYMRLLCEKDPLPYRDLTPRRAYSSGCPAVKETVYITPYGDVCPCPYSHISLGNLLEEPFPTIRNRAMKVPEYRNRVNVCPVGENHTFISRYLTKIYGQKLPVDGIKLFDL